MKIESSKKLGDVLKEYKEKNTDNKYKPVAVGRYGIRKREDIYSKELAKDYSKNKLIYKDTLTVGMGSKQIDIGILTDAEIYAVSPAYHTFRINNIDANYLRYCLDARNADMSERFMIASARQGKSVDFKKMLEYEIPVYSEIDTQTILYNLSKIENIILNLDSQLEKMELLVKSRFIEMFGDPVDNSNKLPLVELSELGSLERGKSKHRPRNAPELLGGPYPLIQTGEVATSGLYITEYNSTYSELGLKQSRMWKAGTLCITIAANIAQTAILTFDACFPDSVVGFVSNGKVTPVYLHYWFTFFQKVIEEQAPQVAQKNINLAILSKLKVVVPDIDVQQSFADFVEQVDKSKLAVQEMKNKMEILKASVMQEYFC